MSEKKSHKIIIGTKNTFYWQSRILNKRGYIFVGRILQSMDQLIKKAKSWVTKQ